MNKRLEIALVKTFYMFCIRELNGKCVFFAHLYKSVSLLLSSDLCLHAVAYLDYMNQTAVDFPQKNKCTSDD